MGNLNSMKYWKIIVVGCILFGCKNDGVGGTSGKLDSICIPVIDSFFHRIETNNYKAALSDLLATNENIDLKDSGTISLEEKFSDINRFSGAYRGKSLLKKKIINDDLAVYSYLVKYDKKFYRFVFVFYNNGTATKIFKFLFDDTLEIEIEESLKLYM
jgi:hypothetical protein